MHGQAAQFRVRCVQVGLPDGARERKRGGGGSQQICMHTAAMATPDPTSTATSDPAPPPPSTPTPTLAATRPFNSK